MVLLSIDDGLKRRTNLDLVKNTIIYFILVNFTNSIKNK